MSTAITFSVKASCRPARPAAATVKAARGNDCTPPAWTATPAALAAAAILLAAPPALARPAANEVAMVAASANSEGFDQNKNLLQSFGEDVKNLGNLVNTDELATTTRKSLQRATAKQSVPPPDEQQADRLQLQPGGEAKQGPGYRGLAETIGRAASNAAVNRE